MPIYPDLRDSVVLVTGGSNGIGAATVTAFRDQQARVFFCDIDASAGEAHAKKSGALFIRVDLRDEKKIARWITHVAKETGHIDALVNNAASDPRIPLKDVTAAKWDELFAINLRSAFLCSRAAVPHMGAGASIINLASITWHLAPAANGRLCRDEGRRAGIHPRPRA